MQLSPKASNKDLADLFDLQGEIQEIIRKERTKLRDFSRSLKRVKNSLKKAPLASSPQFKSLESVLKNLFQVEKELEKAGKIVGSYRGNSNISPFFNSIGSYIYPIIKKGVNLRYLLVRHTPTLKGNPPALHPQQIHLLTKQSDITVDYLRAGCLFEVKDVNAGIVWKPNPIIDGFARELSQIVYGSVPVKTVSLAFNGALGGIKTARVVMEAHAFKHGKIRAHKKSWLEVSSDMMWGNTGLYEFIDDLEGKRLFDILCEDNVVGLFIEPIYNHPAMPVTDLAGLLKRIAKKGGFSKPKYLLIDSAHVPEINPFAYFDNKIPKGLCIFNAMSAVKYMQAGWDISKGGILTILYDKGSWEWDDPLTQLLQFRENMGTGISYEEAALMTIETHKSFLSRMRRYDRNIALMRHKLQDYFQSRGIGKVVCAKESRLLYLAINKVSSEKLREIYLNIIQSAEKQGIPLMDASSFGMSTPHIHFVMHPEVGPIIRISPGSTNYGIVESLIKIVENQIL